MRDSKYNSAGSKISAAKHARMFDTNSLYYACIFDMDGVLINSEPFWRQAQQKIFAEAGLYLTEQDCIETMGTRIDELVAYRYSQHPWEKYSCQEITEKIEDEVCRLVRENGISLPGTEEALKFIKSQNLRLALASSSSSKVINNTLETLNLKHYFEIIHSAEKEPFGKPHPAVFIKTAEKLETAPVRCLVIEDSISGVIAAKAAKMTCIAIPESAVAKSKKFGAADLLLNSLTELQDNWNNINLR